MELEKNSPKPLYAQLNEVIREKIDNGEWKPNEAIPSENELGRIYGVSRMTVRSVLTQLVQEGVLYRIQGKGTFVAEPKITLTTQTQTSMSNMREQLEKEGYSIETKLLEMQVMDCPQHVCEKLGLGAGGKVYRLKRLRYVNGEPNSLHTTYLPYNLVPGLDEKDMEGRKLLDIMERDYGLKRTEITETLESSVATEDEAAHMTLKRGYPVLVLKNISYTMDGTAMDYTKVVFRGDRVKFSFHYQSV